MESPNGVYRAVMQTDGNFVVYGPVNHVSFATGTNSATGAHLIMQADGNLVMYRGNQPIFQTATSGTTPYLAIQDDGNAVVYGSGRALWSVTTGLIPAPIVTFTQLDAGQALTSRQQVTSPNGAYRALMQSDGNFVIYGPGNAVEFATGTNSAPGAHLVMQVDGNLVVYNGDAPIFQTGTSGGSPHFAMQNDGNAVVYGSGRALWSVNTGLLPGPIVSYAQLTAGQALSARQQLVSPNGAYQALMQSDGNFVIYNGALVNFATGTDNAPGAHLVMQADGNLVLYNGSQPVFQTGTSGSDPHFVMQDDGNAVVYGSGRALWSSTAGRIPPPAVQTPPTGPSDVYYPNCAAVREAGKAPLYRGQPGYRAGLDADNDGIACETGH